MNTSIQTKSLEAAKKEITTMLAENWDGICEAYDETFSTFCEEAEEKKKFAYAVSLGVEFAPDGSDMKIRAIIRYGVQHTDESIGQVVSNQPEFELNK